jgi:hypothetical protein
MSNFKRKPLPEDLTAVLKAGIRDVPSAVVIEPERGGEGRQPKAPPTVQVNFNASEEFADLIATLAQEAGSTRRLIARLFRNAGHPVPDADLHPFDNRRRVRKGG